MGGGDEIMYYIMNECDNEKRVSLIGFNEWMMGIRWEGKEKVIFEARMNEHSNSLGIICF